MGSGRQGRAAPSRALGRLEEAVVLAAVVVVAAALRWHWLGQPVRYDEAVTWLQYASQPLPEALSRYDLPNNHLFHTLLAHLTTELLGPGVRALRLPAYLAGVLTVPATWALGRRLHGVRAGLLAAALVAASPVLVLFSANARGYAIVVLAFLVLALLAAELRRRSSALAWVAFAVTAALAGWTMPASLYPAAAVGIWLLWPARKGEASRSLTGRLAGLAAAAVGAAGLAALLYAPVLRRSGWRSVAANRFVAPAPFDEFTVEVQFHDGSVPSQSPMMPVPIINARIPVNGRSI
jgi:4-amino-4-deoxy-L-arabinose transferase-like glycosyltransferase